MSVIWILCFEVTGPVVYVRSLYILAPSIIQLLWTVEVNTNPRKAGIDLGSRNTPPDQLLHHLSQPTIAFVLVCGVKVVRMAYLAHAGDEDTSVSQMLNLSSTLAKIMLSHSPFTVLFCKYACFGSGIL